MPGNKNDAQYYEKLLKDYAKCSNKNVLKNATEMGETFVNRRIFPEEIVSIHMDAVNSLFGEMSKEGKQSLEFLHQTLIAYRKGYERLEKIRMEQRELKSEIAVAANMQKTVLLTETPNVEGLDIGIISVPYHQMNGDYYHFVKRDDGAFGFAIADVIGKGVPAALSMSMIKYAMDHFYEEDMSAKEVLRRLNRIVERNVAASMFITMFYGQYFPKSKIFKYASAGHEPGFLYREKTKQFSMMETKGLVLGVLKESEYPQYELTMETGDMIILLTDGVTECQRDGHFINREEILAIIETYNGLSAQQQVESVYDHFQNGDEFSLRDDFTLMIIKNTV